MIIDGVRVPIEPGDLILTPGWAWHGHVDRGGAEPVVRVDGLDVPSVPGLRAGFMRDDPYSGDPLPVRDTHGNPPPEPPRCSRPTRATDSIAPSAATHGTRPTRPSDG
jgi:gentisate 1,2-dioxygenase